MKTLNKKFVLSIISLLAFLFVANASYGTLWGDKDKALLQAVQSDSLGKFKRLLKKGANPNAIFGKQPEDWVMCEVTDKGRSDFLKAAIKNGGDINLRNEQASNAVASIFSAPLLCAISLHNEEAFMHLLDLGASSDIVACPACKRDIFKRNPIIISAQRNEFKMTYAILIRNERISQFEAERLVHVIESSPINPKSEAKQWQLKVVDWLGSNGHEVEPWSRDKLKKK